MNLLSYSDAADLLHIPVSTLYGWVHRREVPHIRLSPRTVRFDRDELIQWLRARHVHGLRVVSGGDEDDA